MSEPTCRRRPEMQAGRILAGFAGGAVIFLIISTWMSVRPVAADLRGVVHEVQHTEITDRNGLPLGVSYQNPWNTYDYLPLTQMPDFLVHAFVLSEDRHFYAHNGIDWRALASAMWQDIHSFSPVRGASTITEQVVRIVHERPRILWSKWLEGWEAMALERETPKDEILEFYCNEVPYGANRRGIVQAARYYFNRDFTTLTKKEILALVVLARAPTAYDPYRNPAKLESAIAKFAVRLRSEGLLTETELADIGANSLHLESSSLPVDAAHFVSFVRTQDAEAEASDHPVRTTLDARLQQRVQEILAQRLKSLNALSVHNAAAIVVDHRTAEILAWAVAGGEDSLAMPANDQVDTVTVPRQPGSSMKPFLYALALDNGWTPATILDDSPMAESIGSGIHEFKNYSRSYYGKISLREALGNSLNIPALRTIGYIGVDKYLHTLHRLGFESLDRDAGVYKEGLALGNGEVTLLEMAQGYAALAHHGLFRPLRYVIDDSARSDRDQVYSPEAASLIGNILSDPWARRMEFGYGSVLNIPIQTAVKTGTSTDYRDAWTMGFDSRYVVGIWMGNLDRTPMDGVTGAVGPALALHSIFAELHEDQDTSPLYLSPKLTRKDICRNGEGSGCRFTTEYFIPGTENADREETAEPIKLSRPTQGLEIAYDPRIPPDFQIFPFRIDGLERNCLASCSIKWFLNDALLATTEKGTYDWLVRRGKYDLYAQVDSGSDVLFTSGVIHFMVK